MQQINSSTRAIFLLCLFFPVFLWSQVVTEGQQWSFDGRFTLGAAGKRLMYGYPNPHSTSHFVIKVGKYYASNNPSLLGCEPLFALAQRKTEGDAPWVETLYAFDEVIILQQLIPVDRDGQIIDTSSNVLAQYYKVSYQVLNNGNQSKRVGLLLLFDTMIDDNDACVIDAEDRRIRKETVFKRRRKIPKSFLLYRTEDDKDDMLGICITKKDGVELFPPDKVYVGRWPLLSKVHWRVKMWGRSYKDSAILLKWKAKRLRPQQVRQYSTLYGLPDWKEPELELLLNEITDSSETEAVVALPVEVEKEDKVVVVDPPTPKAPTYTYVEYKDTLTLHYALGGSSIKKGDQESIHQFLVQDSISYLLVQGFSDAVGNDQRAEAIAQARIDVAVNYINTLGKGLRVYRQSFANREADMSTYAKQHGKAEDRKTHIIVVGVKRVLDPNSNP